MSRAELMTRIKQLAQETAADARSTEDEKAWAREVFKAIEAAAAQAAKTRTAGV